MTDTASQPKPPKTSAAGGAIYHMNSLTDKWKAFREAIVTHATHTAAERARWEEDRQDRTTYAQRAKTEPGGG